MRSDIAKGRTKIIVSDSAVNIYWQGVEITQSIGLNSGINTLGLWTDSSFAEWKILEKGADYFVVKIRFASLPMSQVWRLHLEREGSINWQIDMEAEEYLHVEEERFVCLASPRYKTWVAGYEQKDFPQISQWNDILLFAEQSRLVGARFPAEGPFLPSLSLEAAGSDAAETYPLVQNTSVNTNAHIIGLRVIHGGGKDYYPGRHRLFSGRITLYDNDIMLDRKVEASRQKSFQETKILAERKITKSNIKVLLANLPWQASGQWGVRAGSRWPHIRDHSEGNYLPFPFFLAYAASLLQKHGIQAAMIDAIAEQTGEDAFIERLSREDFDILVTETSTPSFFYDLNILRRISSLQKPIVLCGPHAEIYQPEFLEQHPFIDFVLFGEYEFSLLELIKQLERGKSLSGIPGLIWRNGGKAIKNQARPPFDINLLPWPNRQGLPMEKYWDLPGDIPHPSAQMLASRGCPFGCSFCLWPQVMYQGNHYRVRDIEDTVDEMEYLVKEKGFKSVYFDDDTFNVGRDRMLKFCQAIKQRGLEATPWAIMARADLMDREILSQMKSAGLWAVKYGVESCVQELVEKYRKDMNLAKTAETIKMTKDLGIKTHLTFCFGVSGETRESIQRTIDFALRQDPDSIQFSILTPFPGTRLFEELDKEGRILTKDWSRYDGHYSCVFQPENLSIEELELAKRRAYHLWADAKRKKRGFAGDLERFKAYLKKYGLSYSIRKALDYVGFILFRRGRYLRGRA
jgi:anaerobic magnesium-protoporphyrin IX monomethyl ester cyclase